MTQFNILGPPRTGRKVLTKGEFYEQVKNWAIEAKEVEVIKKKQTGTKDKSSKKKKGADDILIPEEVLAGPAGGQTSPAALAHPYFVAPGRFSVGGIERVGNVYVFRDLELPMGSWSRLELGANLIQKTPREFNDWAVYTQNSLVAGVSPIDIRYGLMAVCYLNRRKSKFKSITQDIREKVWLPDSKTIPLNATSVIYRQIDSALITPGVGWESSHPFNVEYECEMAGINARIDKMYATSDPSIYSALEGLLGENDPDRCAQIMKWSMSLKDRKVYVPWLGRLGKADHDTRNVVFEKAGTDLDLTAYHSMTRECPARAILADKQFFTKK